MYAIIEAGGRQWRVEPGTRLEINRIAAEVGALHAVTRVLMAQDGTELTIGRPYLEGAQVVCEVLEHPRGPKVISYHYRRRENWRKTVGHRQELTRLLVKDIHLAGAASAAQPKRVPFQLDEPTHTDQRTRTVPAEPHGRPSAERVGTARGAKHGA